MCMYVRVHKVMKLLTTQKADLSHTMNKVMCVQYVAMYLLVIIPIQIIFSLFLDLYC